MLLCKWCEAYCIVIWNHRWLCLHATHSSVCLPKPFTECKCIWSHSQSTDPLIESTVVVFFWSHAISGVAKFYDGRGEKTLWPPLAKIHNSFSFPLFVLSNWKFVESRKREILQLKVHFAALLPRPTIPFVPTLATSLRDILTSTLRVFSMFVVCNTKLMLHTWVLNIIIIIILSSSFSSS